MSQSHQESLTAFLMALFYLQMDERFEAILNRYRIFEFDELNVIETEYMSLSKEEIVERFEKVMEEAYLEGFSGVFFMLGLALVGYVSAAVIQEVMYELIDGMTFADRINDMPEDFTADDLRIKLQTEIHRMYLNGQFYAGDRVAEDGNVITKTWDATMDGRTRPTHYLLNGQEKALDEYFVTRNGRALAPGMFGVGEEDVNCRCILRYNLYSPAPEKALT